EKDYDINILDRNTKNYEKEVDLTLGVVINNTEKLKYGSENKVFPVI
ncbi:3134_t:CDS:2, partial [Funneliformis geosporum]